MKNKLKVAVIGAGLAGVHLSAQLCVAGHEVVLFDEYQKNSASRIAAGLFNIFTGRLAAKTWMAEELLTCLNGFFEQPPFNSLAHFLHRKTIYRPFKTIFELNDWTARFTGTEDDKYVNINPDAICTNLIYNPLGGIHILPCGWLDTSGFLVALIELLQENYALTLVEDRVPFGAIDEKSSSIHGELYDHIVFCDGIGVNKNPYFSHVPIIPLKGQVLEIEMPEYDFEHILSKKVFFIPQGENKYMVGSTYERTFTTLEPDKEGREELEMHIQDAINIPYKIVDHKAGIRPTVKDFRPVVGTHPEHKNVHLFNGLGAKGVIQTPYLSKVFVAYLESGDIGIFPREVRAERFLKYFS